MIELLGTARPAPANDAQRCGCGHLTAHHDAIARRYCAATSAGALARGCVCRAAAVPTGADR